MALLYCVEDDEDIREMILYALKSGGFDARGFESGIEFMQAMREEIPTLVLLDIMLPGEDGLKLLSGLRQDAGYRNVPVIFLTAKSAEYDKVKGLDLGADDYITKPFGVMELLSRVRAVLRRSEGAREQASLLKVRNITMDYDKRNVLVDKQDCALTFKEFELFYYLLYNKGLVLSREKIMERVWGFDFEGESRTVDMHIKTLRQKLAKCGAQDVIVTVRSVGYKIEG